MNKLRLRNIGITIVMILVLTGCTLPGFSTPTPFSFPTPDKTMTALFEPTQAVPATSAADDSSSGSDEDDATVTPKVVPTNTPEITATPEEATVDPTATEIGGISYVGPAVRSGPSITATKIGYGIGIDGDLYEWKTPIQKVINYVVYGAANWTDEDDSSGTVVAAWDEDFLYIGVRVKDNKYVQEGKLEQIYLGDSIEILFDRYVSADYHLQAMTADDYQIGISPGRYGIETCYIVNGKLSTTCTPEPPQAYMWFPKAEAGKKTEIKIGALESGKGYQVEFKIPWSLIGVTNPQEGDHYGFAISISDNDKDGKLLQQTMVSNVSTRFYADPTTWGDLYLK